MMRIDFPKEPDKYNRRRHEYWEENIYNLPKSDKDRKPCYVCYTYPPVPEFVSAFIKEN